jgi:hypothetical protein
MNTTDWNKRFPIGSTVRVTLPSGERVLTITTSQAIQGAAADLIAVLGVPKGYVPLASVEPVLDDVRLSQE